MFFIDSILELLYPNFIRTTEEIASHLKISIEKVEIALKFLEEHDFIKVQKDPVFGVNNVKLSKAVSDFYDVILTLELEEHKK